jgi:hypothetical protein
MSGDVKETVFRKNEMGGYILACDEQFTKFIFWLSLKQKPLFAYTENTLNGKKVLKVYISQLIIIHIF